MSMGRGGMGPELKLRFGREGESKGKVLGRESRVSSVPPFSMAVR